MSFYEPLNRNEACMWAIQNKVQTIHNLTRLDNCLTDYVATNKIVTQGLNAKLDGVSAYDYEVTKNIKEVWNLIINNYDILTVDLNTFKEFNKILGQGGIVSRAGKLRNHEIQMTGTSYFSTPPVETQFEERLNDILNIKNSEEKIIELITFGIREQFFSDANKRTTFMFANLVSIKENIGIISLSETQFNDEFVPALVELFEKNDSKQMSTIIKGAIKYTPEYIEKIESKVNNKQKM